ncbi:hypothetical protein [Pseudonocardia sp. NPDC049635]|uniref:hypothetical protein n=1 Tax=Pseudonocardia sp. NPDC049635 TaxID=3155506 RepID=UPI0033F54C46
MPARPPRSRTVLLVLVLPAAVVLAGLVVLYVLNREQHWEGEFPARVRYVNGTDGTMSVRLSPPGPPDALSAGFVRSDRIELIPGARSGDPLVCHIRQTYVVNKHLATGSETELISCRRA